MFRRLALFAALALLATPAAAKLDLGKADISYLPNGLTVLILEDHSFPVVSVQALYKSGARDEIAGKTGLAHFLEHLAFRASTNFPKAGATEAIYDAGGEWHGYTWIDQTTYFATMPRDGLDLLLRIEADRMARVTIDDAAIAAEKGAVLTEMHGYENDPASVLLDAVTATAFQTDTYRNNTIGLQRDVEALTAHDARAFYERHYVPANAVLAIVGDIEAETARTLVGRYFAGLSSRPAPPHAAPNEPPQRGERRLMLHGAVDRQHFLFAYPAPAASNRDLPAFLVLQQLLSGGSGLNFRQNDWGAPTEAGSVLHGAASDLATWFIPTAERYIFTIQGSAAANADRAAIERDIGRRLDIVREGAVIPQRLAAARAAVLDQLDADIETTEDAAHQLAFMTGVGAYDMLAHLPERVAAVTSDDVRRVAHDYLNPQFRTVGWYVPGGVASQAGLGSSAAATPPAQRGIPAPHDALPTARMIRLRNGLPVMVQPSPIGDRVTVQALMTAPVKGEQRPADLPGLGVIARSGRAAELPDLIDSVRAAVKSATPSLNADGDDPDSTLERMIAPAMGVGPGGMPRAVLMVVSGAVDDAATESQLERAFGDVRPATLDHVHRAPGPVALQGVRLPKPFAQGAIGYVVTAAPPSMRQALAWQMLLYVLAHDYSGRLGRSAIGDKGLTYYIDGSYRTNGRKSWIVIKSGVDPDKADAFTEELRQQLARLASDPPTDAEVDAARRHILGRDISAAQSNDELAAKLVRQFVETGAPRSHAQLEADVRSISRNDVLALITSFTSGTIFRVDVQPQGSK